MISATGRIPCTAAPIAAPAIAISEIGELRTRSGPNSSSIPAVTPIEPGPGQLDRVAGLAQPPRLALVAVDLRVADVMARETDRLEVDEDRAAAAARLVESLARSPVDGLDVLPVRLHGLHPERLRTV